MNNPVFISIFCAVCFLTACGMGEKSTVNRFSATEMASTQISMGVPECDEYFARVGNFMNNPEVPHTERDAYRQTLEQNRMAWQQAATSLQTRSQLEKSCRTALDFIRPALEQYEK